MKKLSHQSKIISKESREVIRQQAIEEVAEWLRQRAIRFSKEKAEPLEIVALMAAVDDLASECLWMET